MMRTVSFCVAGMDFVIQTEEDPEYIRRLALELDRRISVYLRMGSKVTLSMSSVLTAMEYNDECQKYKSDIENLRRQLTSYINEASVSADRIDKLQYELKNTGGKDTSLEEENRQLREQIGKLVEQISSEGNYVSAPGELEAENRRLCEELEKANAYIDDASRAINEKRDMLRRIEELSDEVVRLTDENKELNELLDMH